jgi:hypothetical protein
VLIAKHRALHDADTVATGGHTGSSIALSLPHARVQSDGDPDQRIHECIATHNPHTKPRGSDAHIKFCIRRLTCSSCCIPSMLLKSLRSLDRPQDLESFTARASHMPTAPFHRPTSGWLNSNADRDRRALPAAPGPTVRYKRSKISDVKRSCAFDALTACRCSRVLSLPLTA